MMHIPRGGIYCVVLLCLVLLAGLNPALGRKRTREGDRTRHHKTDQSSDEGLSTTADKPPSLTTQQTRIENYSSTEKPLRHHIVATTKQGRVRGRATRTQLDVPVACFLGIQYGRPPIGKLRFRKPEPTKRWKGVRDATKYANSCYQWRDNSFGAGYPGTEMWNANTPLSEDCLYLNVWVPMKTDSPTAKDSIRHDPPLPVMVWIYGGGFYSGTSSLDVYDGKWLASTEQVIVVSMNYRVAALGFLATGGENAPGNVGLWDQNLALLWIQSNIRHFGGDPSRVTLFGESAGAASVAMHVISDHSHGLFRNAILQSASVLSPWAIIPKDEATRRAVQLSGILGCSDSNATENNPPLEQMTECLRTIDPQKLVDEEMGMEDFGTARFAAGAVVEGDFLTDKQVDELENGEFETDVNILAGFNKNEGNYFLVYGSPGFLIDSNIPIDYAQYRKGLFRGLCADTRNQNGSRFEEIPDTLLDVIDFEYTSFERTLSDREFCSYKNEEYACSSQPVKTSLDEYLEAPNSYKAVLDHIIGDTNFICPTINFMRNILQMDSQNKPLGNGLDVKILRGKKYLYQFLHRSTKTPWPKWMGVLHGYEIEFAFGIPLNKSLGYTEEEVQLAKEMMKYWANFAKTGDPNEDGTTGKGAEKQLSWPEYTLRDEASLIFDTTSGRSSSAEIIAINNVQKQTKRRHCSFWRSYLPRLEEKFEDMSGNHQTCIIQESRNSAMEIFNIALLSWTAVATASYRLLYGV